MAEDARVLLVETSDALPGLLPFQAWDALATAEEVYVRDPQAHPSAPYLYQAGLDLTPLQPARLEMAEMNLAVPGDPEDRRYAKALLTRAAETGRVVYLLGPDDERLATAMAASAPDYDAELEMVFFAPQPPGTEVLRLVEVERRLRDPEGGCPWDLEQDHASLRPYLLEEAHELLEAIDRGVDAEIVEELGDLLLQVVFHAQVGTDRRAFTVDEVARGIADKLVRRHPHVFGDVEVEDAGEVMRNWDELKQAEKARAGPFDGIPGALPALMLATKYQRRAARRGFDWRDAGEPAARVREELAELDAAADERTEEEVGDLLGAVVGLARHLDVDPEQALLRAVAKFRDRFERVLGRVEAAGEDPATLNRDAWLAHWEAVKGDAG